jgi:hypothetical protein
MKRNRIKELYYKIKFRKMVTTNLSAGTKLVIVSNTSSHNYAIGTKITFRDYYPNQPEWFYANEGNCSTAIRFSDVRLDSYTEKDIQEELKLAEEKLTEAKTNVENVKLKLEFIKETGASIFNENEYRAYNTLKTLENSKLSTLEKAKQIASLFNK